MGAFRTAVKATIGVLATTAIIGVGCTALGLGALDSAIESTDKEVTKVEKDLNEKATKVTKENYDKIVQGDVMTGEGGSSKDEVISLLGEPQVSGENVIDSETTYENMSWSSIRGGANITVSLIGGKVSSKSFTKIK